MSSCCSMTKLAMIDRIRGEARDVAPGGWRPWCEGVLRMVYLEHVLSLRASSSTCLKRQVAGRSGKFDGCPGRLTCISCLECGRGAVWGCIESRRQKYHRERQGNVGSHLILTEGSYYSSVSNWLRRDCEEERTRKTGRAIQAGRGSVLL